MSGKLFVIGVGPGDPELLTLKAVRILKEVPCIIVPKGKEEGSSLALTIVQKALSLDNKEIVEAYFPMKPTRVSESPSPTPPIKGGATTVHPLPGVCPRMTLSGVGEGRGLHPTSTSASASAGREGGIYDRGATAELNRSWDATVEEVLNRLDRGIDAAFITIGDPGIYSTFFYLYDRLLERKPSLAIEIVPGVSSINAAAARAGVSLGLGNERIAILPANYLDSLEETLEKFDTVVLMKVSKVFDTVKDTLTRMNLASTAAYVVRAGMDDERVYKDIGQVREEDLNYFSLMIVRKR
jgi:precorrin-2/cobalt-factor-2 C20-methyltransferase